MKIKDNLFFFLFVLSFTTCQQPPTGIQIATNFSLKTGNINGTKAIIINRTDYDFLLSKNILLSQEWTTYDHGISGLEGSGGRVRVKAIQFSHDLKTSKPLWEFTDDDAESGELIESSRDLFYRTTQYGCCGSSSSNKLFDAKTGRLVSHFSDQAIVVNAPALPYLVISYYSPVWAADGHAAKNEPDLIGTLTLAMENKDTIQQLLIYGPKDPARLEKLHLVEDSTMTTVEHYNNVDIIDMDDRYNFKIAAEFGDFHLEIPIRELKFDINGLSLPANIKLVYKTDVPRP
jgi:hypothetical protein